MPDPYQQLIDDLVAEQQYLDAQLAYLADDVWQNDTPCRGWMVRDVISHLAEVDESATNVALGKSRSMTGGERSDDGTRSALQDSSRHMTRIQLVDWWRAGRNRMEAALRARDGRDRMPWAGPPMSARSFATARLMECWSHGLDALDGAGIEPVHSDRLQHIAHLGYITRQFAYQTRGMEPNTEPLRVELSLPSGATWARGDDDAEHLVSGAAPDFCRVVTQRIHYKDTNLSYTPGPAEEFLQVAQAFAGPPGEGRPQRRSSDPASG